MLGAPDKDWADLKGKQELPGWREEESGVPGKWKMKAEGAEIREVCPERWFVQAHPPKATVPPTTPHLVVTNA